MNLLCVLAVFSLLGGRCHGGCAEVDSLTEAVIGEGFLLGCISCKTREVPAESTVDWHYRPPGQDQFIHVSPPPSSKTRSGPGMKERPDCPPTPSKTSYVSVLLRRNTVVATAVVGQTHGGEAVSLQYQHLHHHSITLTPFTRLPGGPSWSQIQIFHYNHPVADVLHQDFGHRLDWHGTPGRDIQIGTIYIHNVTYNDSGTYRCTFHRTLILPMYNQQVTVEKEVDLTVVAVANRELTSVISEIMMYVVIVFLQLWLVGILVYCYKKTWNEHEAHEARRALKAQAALLEVKDDCDEEQLEE